VPFEETNKKVRTEQKGVRSDPTSDILDGGIFLQRKLQYVYNTLSVGHASLLSRHDVVEACRSKENCTSTTGHATGTGMVEDAFGLISIVGFTLQQYRQSV
jgi:hypothetical protein